MVECHNWAKNPMAVQVAQAVAQISGMRL